MKLALTVRHAIISMSKFFVAPIFTSPTITVGELGVDSLSGQTALRIG